MSKEDAQENFMMSVRARFDELARRLRARRPTPGGA